LIKRFIKATSHDLESLSAEELSAHNEIIDLLMADGLSPEEAENAAYLSLFAK
jgi:hypothetical protein